MPGGPVPRGAMPGGPVPGGSVPGGPARGGHRGLAVTALVAGIILAVVLAVVAVRLHARNQDAQGAGGASSPVVSAPATGTVNTPQALLALTPAQVVQRYYQLINQHRYGRAWLLGGDHSRAGITYPAYVAGFAGTARDNVRILQVNGSVVTARLTALQDNGSAKIFQGTYTVADATIMSFDVVREQ
jgi:hypothetical protein